MNPFHPLRYSIAEARDHLRSQLPLELESDEDFKRYHDVLRLADRRSGKVCFREETFFPLILLSSSSELFSPGFITVCHVSCPYLDPFSCLPQPKCLSVTEIPAKYYGAWRKLRLTLEAERIEELACELAWGTDGI